MLQKLRFGSPGLVCCGSLSVLFLYVVWPWSVCTFSLSRSPDSRCPGLAWCAAPPFLCGWWCWGTLRPPCQADSRHPPAGLAAPRGPAGCGARQAQSLRCLAKCTRRLQIRRQQTRRCVARTLDLLLGGASGLATTWAPRWVRRAGGRHRLSRGCCVRGLSSPAPTSSGWLTVAVHVFRSCLEGKDGL